MTKQALLLIASMGLFSFTACSQNDAPVEPESNKEAPEKPIVKKERPRELHPYGGWYCPDNLGGFPPANVQMLDKIEVVEGRLPTQEETRNGTSLMYFDTEKVPGAKSLELGLPRLAKYYTTYSDKEELVIIIQAVTAGSDTVVGFRYVNGGNGSAWFDEVSFLTDEEVEAIGPTPFVFFSERIQAPKEKVWEAIIKTTYARELGERFNQQAFFGSPWEDGSRVRLDYETIGEKANGSASLLFGNIYMQINYTFAGRDYVEKLLILDSEDGGAKLEFVSGPYSSDSFAEEAQWREWLQEVITLSEAK